MTAIKKGRGNRPKAEMKNKHDVCYGFYLSYASLAQMSAATGASQNTIMKWIEDEKWEERRTALDEKLRTELEKNALRSKLSDTKELASAANQLLDAGLQQINDTYETADGERYEMKPGEKIDLAIKLDKHRLLVTGEDKERREDITGVDLIAAEKQIKEVEAYEKVPLR